MLLDLELSSLAEGNSKRCESPLELLFLIEVEWESNSSPVPLLRILGTSPRVPEHFKGLPDKNCELGRQSCLPILTSFACSSELLAKPSSRRKNVLKDVNYGGAMVHIMDHLVAVNKVYSRDKSVHIQRFFHVLVYSVP